MNFNSINKNKQTSLTYFQQKAKERTSADALQKEAKKVAKLDQILSGLKPVIEMCEKSGLYEVKSSLKIVEKKILDKKKKSEKAIQNENSSLSRQQKTAYQLWWDSIKDGLKLKPAEDQ